MLKNWQEHLFVSDNVRADIAENQFTQPDESDLIQKIKQLETMYEKCEQLLHNQLNDTYTLLLLHAHKCQPSGVVSGELCSRGTWIKDNQPL